MRFLLADDHPVLRQGLRQLLERDFPACKVDEASDATETLQRLGQHPYDVLILDVSMPGRSGLDVLPEIHQRHPGLRILVLSMHPASAFAERALAAGATGYLTKDRAPEDLVEGVREALEGRVFVSRSAV